MFIPGLVSITFRPLSPREIVALCVETKLRAVEWGGDFHVPPGDVGRAREVGAMTREAGLQVACYGSYYRADGNEDFGPVLDAAEALGAPSIRVWAGRGDSKDADVAYRAQVAADLRQCAEAASERNIIVTTEWHDGTLTDDLQSAQALFAAVAHPDLKTLWQPPHHLSVEERLADLRAVSQLLSHAHVFHWRDAGRDRRPLSEGVDEWRRYLGVLRKNGREVPLLLEFVRGDGVEQLREDAATLNALLGS